MFQLKKVKRAKHTPYVQYFRKSFILRRNVENVNLLTPNVNYSGRTAPLTSKVAFYIFIQQI